MSILIKFYKDRIPHRWYRIGERLIQVTPSYLDGSKTRIYHYEYIENSERKGCFIVGFYLYDNMVRITHDEWEKAIVNCN